MGRKKKLHTADNLCIGLLVGGLGYMGGWWVAASMVVLVVWAVRSAQ